MANPPKGMAKEKLDAAKEPAARGGKAATSRAKAEPVDSGQKYVVSGTVTYADGTPAACFNKRGHARITFRVINCDPRLFVNTK